MKQCKKCGESKPVDDFYRAAGTRDGLRGECKACNAAAKRAWYKANRGHVIENVKRWQQDNAERHNENQRRRRQRPEVRARERAGHLRRKFGITPEQYDEMLAAQGGVCALCGRPPTEGISLHVDHDHETGATRKLLCFRCNNALGDLGDDPDLLRSAASYLDAHDPEAQHQKRRAQDRARALRR